MKAELLVVGKTTNAHIAACVEDYVGRIGHYMPFVVRVIPEVKNRKSLTEQMQKEFEGEQILRRVDAGAYVVLLDEYGEGYDSREFAEWLNRKQVSTRCLLFVVGGPYGFSRAVYERANERLSLSRMTFSHELVRVVFTEQLYRACTIIKGEPYHHK